MYNVLCREYTFGCTRMESDVLEVAEGIFGGHVLDHPFVGLGGRHLPAGIACGDNLDNGGAFLGHGVLEGVADSGLGLADGSGGVDRLACHVACAVETGEDVGDLDGIAIEVYAAAIGSGGCLLTDEGGRGHLAAGHAVDGVVDEDDDDVLATVGGMDGLGGTDGGEVTVALIGEDDVAGIEARDGGGNGGSASVCGLDPVDVDVVVGEYGAAYGSDADGLVLNAEFVDDFGEYLVNDAVGASGTVVCVRVQEESRAGDNLIFGFDDIFGFHDCLVLMVKITSWRFRGNLSLRRR